MPKQPMRITFVTQEFAGVSPYTGGIGVHFEVLARGLAARGHEITVITKGPRDSPGRLQHDGCDVRLVPFGTTDAQFARAAEQIARSLEQPDLYFAAEWDGDAHRLTGGAAPVITNLATSLEQIVVLNTRPGQPLTRLPDPDQLFRERYQTENSRGIVACSTAILNWSRRLWDISGIRSEVIPNFIDVDRVRNLSRGETPAEFPRSRRTVVYFGRLEERKGMLTLAKAMESVWRQHPDVDFVFIGGDGPYAGGTMSEHIIQSNPGRRSQIHFLPNMAPEQLMPCVARATAVVMPSDWECFGMAALEARALGKAMVVTSGSGFDDFFEDGKNGLQVPPRDPDALADAMCRLLDSPKLTQQIGEAAERDAKQYTPEAVVPRIEAFFARVISRNLQIGKTA